MYVHIVYVYICTYVWAWFKNLYDGHGLSNQSALWILSKKIMYICMYKVRLH